MVVNTRIFGEITIEDDRVIHFANGIIGFPEMTDFALVHNEEEGNKAGIRWMQSMQEPEFAIPVIDPLSIIQGYDPEVNDELLLPLGELNPEEMLVLVTITVPKEITQMSVNLRAPIVINAGTKKACQMIAEGENYSIKYPIYEILQEAKKAVKEGE